MDTYYGEIRMFAGNYAPRGWALCDGQLLPINENQVLFSILGTIYGGDGRTDFALPDLRGRAPIHVGDSRGPGLSHHRLGERGGLEQTERQPIQIKSGSGADATVLSGRQAEANNMQPYLAVNFIIALQGHIPPRN